MIRDGSTFCNHRTGGDEMRGRARWIALGAVLALGVGIAAVAGAATRTHTQKFAGPPIVIGAAVDLTKNMAPFDAPAVQAAQIEIKKINAEGGVLGRPLQLKVINDQLDPQKTKQAALTADLQRCRDRLGHLRRRLRDAGDPGVPQRQDADDRAVHRHRPDGPLALRRCRASSRSATATRRRTRARRWPQYAFKQRLAVERRRDRQPARVLQERLQGVHDPLPAARRQDRRRRSRSPRATRRSATSSPA